MGKQKARYYYQIDYIDVYDCDKVLAKDEDNDLYLVSSY